MKKIKFTDLKDLARKGGKKSDDFAGGADLIKNPQPQEAATEKNIGGRPRKPPGQEKNKYIPVYLTIEEREKVSAFVSSRGMTASGLIRSLLKRKGALD